MFPEMSFFGSIRKACFDAEIPKLMEITKLSGSMPKVNKYRSNPSSAANFSSNLNRIQEGSHEDEESSEESLESHESVSRDGDEDSEMSLAKETDKPAHNMAPHEGTEKTFMGESNQTISGIGMTSKGLSMRVELDGSVSSMGFMEEAEESST